MPEKIHVASAFQSELVSAFCLLFQHAPLEDRQRGVDDALALVAKGNILPENILVVRESEQVRGVAVIALNAAATGQVWPPQVRPGLLREQIEDALLGEAIRRLRQAGAKFVHALLTDHDLPAVPCLARGGFDPLAKLSTLFHPLNALEEWAAVSPSPDLSYESLLEAGEGLFQEVLLATYEDTLDFPELNGIRDVGELLDIHRQQGIFHPEQWLLVREAGQVVGMLLLAEVPEAQEWELSYVGVVRAARGRGIGKQLVREALRRAAAMPAGRLMVSVDSRNFPACRLYAGLGFQPLEEHQVHFLPAADDAPRIP